MAAPPKTVGLGRHGPAFAAVVGGMFAPRHRCADCDEEVKAGDFLTDRLREIPTPVCREILNRTIAGDTM